MLADDAPALTRGIPGIENAPKTPSQVVQVRDLSLPESAHVNARGWLCAPKRDDAPDLCQGQSQASGLRYEVEHADDIPRIRAVAGRRASRWREDASRLVQPQSLAVRPLRVATSPMTSPSRAIWSRISLAPWGRQEGDCTLKSHLDTVSTREVLIRRAVWLEIGTVAWNAIEGIIAVAAGIVAVGGARWLRCGLLCGDNERRRCRMAPARRTRRSA